MTVLPWFPLLRKRLLQPSPHHTTATGLLRLPPQMEVKCHILAQMFIETGLEATEAMEEALEAADAEAVGSEDETDEAEQEAGETVQE